MIPKEGLALGATVNVRPNLFRYLRLELVVGEPDDVGVGAVAVAAVLIYFSPLGVAR